MNFNEEFKKLPNQTPFTKYAVQCRDGFIMSVQASAYHYCEPRENDMECYSSFEVGFPTEPEELLLPYAEEPDRPTQTVYGWVPVSVIEQVVAKHGGLPPIIDMVAQ